MIKPSKKNSSIKSDSPVDVTPLRQDIPEEFRDPLPNILEPVEPEAVDWSAAQNRSDDLAEHRDPFTQQPERNTVPPELIQERAYRLWAQRGSPEGSNLADWFEAQRQIKSEIDSNLSRG